MGPNEIEDAVDRLEEAEQATVASDEAQAATEASEGPPAVHGRPRKPYKWGGAIVPLFDYNSTDGVGFGVGVEVFDRKRELDHGYRHRVSAWTFWTTSANYNSNFLQYENRSKHYLVARLAYRTWRQMLYEGVGGADVSVYKPPEIAQGNVTLGPSLLLTATFEIPRSPLYIWVQGYGRYTFGEARPGGLLAQRRPFGLGTVFYFDTSFGVALQETDRWPLPNKGLRFEASTRFGGSTGDGTGFHPLFGVNTELTGWWPLVGQWLVLGGRLLFDRTWGDRPYWEQEWLGGTLRDEVAYEQMLTGYARTRSRGDGVFAGIVELRGHFGRTRHPFFDIGFYGSVFAETAFLFKGDDPGPHLPTVGVGPELLWQGAVILRPFVAWGWISEAEGLPRQPSPQFGIGVLSPL